MKTLAPRSLISGLFPDARDGCGTSLRFAFFPPCARSKPRDEVSCLRAQAKYNVGAIL